MIQPRIVRGFASFVLVLAAYAMLAPGALARSDTAYTVRGIAVDSRAVSAAEARAVALAEGQRMAFDRLLRRLVLLEDQVLLPTLDDARIAQTVDGYIIGKELVSTTRYRATLIFDFNKSAIRKLLRERKIRFAETRSKEVLVVPVFDTGKGGVIWQEPGDWRRAWLARPDDGGLVPMILPLGDVMDMAAISPAEALAPSREALSRLAERYGTSEIVVAAAVFEAPPPGAEGDSSAANGAPDGTETADVAAPASAVTRRARGPVEGALLRLTVHRVGVAGVRKTSELLRGAPSESKEEFLARAVDRVVAQVEEGWKQANMLRFGRENTLRIEVPLQSLADWVDMRRRLGDLAVVVAVELTALSRGRAEILLRYLGETEQLALGLEQSDLVLKSESSGWVLRSEGGGAPRGQGGKTLQ